MKTRVVRILHPWMPSYRVQFFRELIEIGNAADVRYEIFAGSVPYDSRNRSDGIISSDIHTDIHQRAFYFLGREGIIYSLPSQWYKADLIIYEHALRNLNCMFDLFLGRSHNIALWGHGKTFTKEKSKWEILLQKGLVRRAVHFFAYTNLGAKEVSNIRNDEKFCTSVQNSTDTEILRSEISTTTRAEVNAFIESDKLCGFQICAFVGALDESKRLEFLLNAAQKIYQSNSNFKLLVFGDGPLRTYVEAEARTRSYLIYKGRAGLKELALISKTAQAILNPGRVGLLAVDALTMGVPIVTTNFRYHAPEFEYLTSGRNCVISENSLESYVAAALRLLADGDLRENLASNCIEDSGSFSIQIMAKRFHSGVLQALEHSDDY